jgi:hypothetical protein
MSSKTPRVTKLYRNDGSYIDRVTLTHLFNLNITLRCRLLGSPKASPSKRSYRDDRDYQDTKQPKSTHIYQYQLAP